jgi:hypothetical protein
MKTITSGTHTLLYVVKNSPVTYKVSNPLSDRPLRMNIGMIRIVHFEQLIYRVSQLDSDLYKHQFTPIHYF